MKEICIWKKFSAEVFGTFVLVFVAVGVAVMVGSASGGAVPFFIAPTALAFGLVIVAMAYSIGGISGCHINPAVSLAMLIRKKLTLKEFGVYVLAQIIGAVLGAVALYGLIAMWTGSMDLTLAVWGTNGIGTPLEAGTVIGAFLIEIILTFIFVYVILCVVNKKDFNATGLVIGLTLTLVHLIGIPFTGTSVNPARSLGVALIAPIFDGGTVALEQIWIFLLAPMGGAALAALVFGWLNKEEINKEEVESPAA